MEFLSFLFLFVILLLGCASCGAGFVVFWPFVSLILLMLLPRGMRVPMLKRLLPMGEYMGWDDVFPQKLRYRPRRRSKGFLLVEVVIAVAVLGISLSALLSLVSCRQKLRVAGERAARVRIAAESEMERLKGEAHGDLKVGTSRTFTIPLPAGRCTGTVFIEKHPHPGIKRIRVVAGDEGGMEIERIEIITLVAARKEGAP